MNQGVAFFQWFLGVFVNISMGGSFINCMCIGGTDFRFPSSTCPPLHKFIRHKFNLISTFFNSGTRVIYHPWDPNISLN